MGAQAAEASTSLSRQAAAVYGLGAAGAATLGAIGGTAIATANRKYQEATQDDPSPMQRALGNRPR